MARELAERDERVSKALTELVRNTIGDYLAVQDEYASLVSSILADEGLVQADDGRLIEVVNRRDIYGSRVLRRLRGEHVTD